MFRFPIRAKLMPFHLFLQDALQDAATFHLLLAHSAHHLASLNKTVSTEEAMKHKIRGIQIVNERMSNLETSVCDGNVQAAIFMIAIEVILSVNISASRLIDNFCWSGSIR
jgi:hypothetical protein